MAHMSPPAIELDQEAGGRHRLSHYFTWAFGPCCYLNGCALEVPACSFHLISFYPVFIAVRQFGSFAIFEKLALIDSLRNHNLNRTSWLVPMTVTFRLLFGHDLRIFLLMRLILQGQFLRERSSLLLYTAQLSWIKRFKDISKKDDTIRYGSE